jgi:hypothetical protein
MYQYFIIIICIVCFFILLTKGKENNKGIFFTKITPIIIVLIYCGALTLFIIGLSFHGEPYYQSIDPLDRDYSPFGENQILTIIVFTTLFIISATQISVNGTKLPPIIFVVCAIFLIIGLILSFVILLQIMFRNHDSDAQNGDYLLLFGMMPIMNILLTFRLLGNVVNEEITLSQNRYYQNKILRYLNTFLSAKQKYSYWFSILLLPVFVLITLILMLFGQDSDSIIKLFSETTTWGFSQKTHPIYLDHRGHYLCTVAAYGNPKIVKPIRIGKRHGNEIIVNRQLMIANAFEELIQDYLPRFHKIIRSFYDKYGFQLSKHINSPFFSNVTYIMMKPLEWFFLFNIYLFCGNPEVKINRQYV